MNNLNKEKLLQLIKAAQQTAYFEELDWQGKSINQIAYELENNPEDECEYYDLIEAAEDMAFGDNTAPLPREVMNLVTYVYAFAIEEKDGNRVNDYATLFYTGRAGEQDFEKAAHYYQMASDMGCPWSIENLGYIYYYGRTGKVDYQKAYMQFSKGSAVYSRACSTYKLGDMYRNGYYVNKDEKSAYNCYRRAEKLIDNGQTENYADNVAADIYFRLGQCMHKGIGTDVNLDEALNYYQKAELGFIEKVRNGDFLVKKMLVASVEAQDELRELIYKDLPEMEWTKKNTGYKTI